MIDFSTSQLTWIVIGACSLGGTGYLTINTSIDDIDKKVAVSNVKAENANEKLSILRAQLDRIEQKLDDRGGKQ